jgi:tetratricopeptide (TPR) repeat protein
VHFNHLNILILLNINLFAQNPAKIDSLQRDLNTNLSDIKRANIFHQIVNFYLNKNEDSAKKYISLNIHYSEKSKDLSAIGKAYLQLGVHLTNHNQYEVGIKNIVKAINYFEKANDLRWTGKAYSSLGYIYKKMADAQKIISFTKKGESYLH